MGEASALVLGSYRQHPEKGLAAHTCAARLLSYESQSPSPLLLGGRQASNLPSPCLSPSICRMGQHKYLAEVRGTVASTDKLILALSLHHRVTR